MMDSVKDFRTWGLVLLLALLPLPYGAVELWARNAYMIFVILLATAWLLEMNWDGKWMWRRTWADIPFGLLLIWACVTTYTSSDRYDSFEETSLYVTHGILFYLVVQTVQQRDQVLRILYALVISATLLSLFGLLQYTGALPRGWWHVRTFLSASYVNHNHFAGYLELMLPMTLGLWLYVPERWTKNLLIYALGIMSIAFALTLSRGGWISMAVGLVAMAYLVNSGKWRKVDSKFQWRWISFSVLGVVVAIYVFLTLAANPIIDRLSTMTRGGNESLSYSVRPKIYSATFNMFMDNPVFGVGPGTFVHGFQQYRPAGVAYRIHYAHNDYLQLAAEMGLLGLVLFIVFGGVIVLSGVAIVRSTENQFSRFVTGGLVCGLISIAVHSVVDFNLHIPANAALMSVWAGLVMGVGMRSTSIRD